MKLCFQFVTRGRAVINSEPEEQDSVEAATAQAKAWMALKGQTLAFGTYDSGGAVVKVDELEHVAVMTPETMARLYADDAELVRRGRVEGLRTALAAVENPDGDYASEITRLLADAGAGQER